MKPKKPSTPPIDDEANCRIFLSVDVVGSTEYKHKRTTGGVPDWFPFFRRFYEEFPVLFSEICGERRAETEDFPLERGFRDCEPQVWKSLGDELLFYAHIEHHVQAELFVAALRDALMRYRSEMEPGLKLKACAWLAAFPLRNAEIHFLDKVDFIGPQIDIGFRLAQFASSTRLMVSCELALLLVNRTNSLDFYYSGKRVLKGVLKDQGYPLIWLQVPDPAQSDSERVLFRNVDSFKLKKFCREYIAARGLPLELPYLPGDPAFAEEPPDYHSELERVTRMRADDRAIEEMYRDADNRATPSTKSSSKTKADARAHSQAPDPDR